MNIKNSEITHNDFFLSDLTLLKNSNFFEEIKAFSLKNSYAKEFIHNINKFINKNQILFKYNSENEDILKKIQKEYWFIILNLYKYFENFTPNSSHLKHYIICTTRVFELLVIIYHKNNKNLNNIYFNEETKNHNTFYFFLKEIKLNDKMNHFNIIKDKNSSKSEIYLYNDNNDYIKTINDEYSYFSSLKIQPFKDSSISLFDNYFKLNKNYVENFFSANDSLGVSHKIRFTGRKKPFQIVDKIKLKSTNIEEDKKSDKKSFESDLESKNHIKKLKSPIFDKKNTHLINKDLNKLLVKNDISSKFKHYLISKAISNSITKRNLKLKSTYHYPEFETFKDFIFTTFNLKEAYTKILLLNFFTGFDINNLIYALISSNDDIRYTKKAILNIKINEKIFDSTFANSQFTKEKKSKTASIHLNHEINIIWQECENFLFKKLFKKLKSIKWQKKLISKSDFKINKEVLNSIKTQEDSSNIDNFFKKTIEHLPEKHNEIKRLKDGVLNLFVKEIHTELGEIFKKNLAIYKKKRHIILHLATISQLSQHYFNIYGKGCDIPMLYTQVVSNNDASRMCYSSIKNRLYNVEEWMNFLYQVLMDKNSKFSEIEETFNYNNNWIGSAFYIKPNAFNEFIVSLEKLKTTNKYEIFNLNMIFIRFGLSILLGTRDFINSANLSDFSTVSKILILQEKGKNIYQGKRIIPLCNHALLLIKMFHKLKIHFNIVSNFPILLDSELNEIIINKENLITFFDLIDNSTNYKFLKNIKEFILYTKLNFGRHIITSYLSHSSIEPNYIDAFLNHYKMGKEDQGIFSNFNNPKYLDSIKKHLDEIANIYFPEKIMIGNYEYRFSF